MFLRPSNICVNITCGIYQDISSILFGCLFTIVTNPEGDLALTHTELVNTVWPM